MRPAPRSRGAAGGVALWLSLTACAAVALATPLNRDVSGRPRGGTVRDEPAAGPEIRDPLFELLVALAEGDSLGAWDEAQLQAHVARSGRPTRLPLASLRRIERRPATLAEDEALGGARVSRVWHLVLDDALDFPMPYSILGYHPGTLRISRELVLDEWRLGAANVRLAPGDTARVHALAGAICWRLREGKLVLDADGWLDKLLGGALDDSWTEGLALGRLEGRLVGIALGVNPQERRLLGEFDFRADKVFPHGRPPARALASLCRPFTAPRAGLPSRAWRE